MKKLLATVSILGLLASPALAKFTDTHADILICKVSGKQMGADVSYIVKIVPATPEEVLSEDIHLWTHENRTDPTNVKVIDLGVGVGRIDMNGETHSFVQLQDGTDGGWSLMGFFIDKGFLTHVMVDVWDKKNKMPIRLYDPYMNSEEILSGECS